MYRLTRAACFSTGFVWNRFGLPTYTFYSFESKSFSLPLKYRTVVTIRIMAGIIANIKRKTASDVIANHRKRKTVGPNRIHNPKNTIGFWLLVASEIDRPSDMAAITGSRVTVAPIGALHFSQKETPSLFSCKH